MDITKLQIIANTHFTINHRVAKYLLSELTINHCLDYRDIWKIRCKVTPLVRLKVTPWS